MQWMSPLFNWLTFFSAVEERNERESNDKTLVADKPNEGEPPRWPKSLLLTNFTYNRNANI